MVKLKGIAACCIAACWLAGAVRAQTAPPPSKPSTPEVVPPASTLAPPVIEPSRPVLPAQPAVAPELGKPDDDVRLSVTRYAVDADAPPELIAALPELTARFTGPDRSFEDLAAAAAEVTRFLQRELGLYLGYAYLPEQSPQDGVIRIAVLEGRLDRVVLEWTDGLPVERSVVEAYLARLQPGSVLRVRDVERVVFLVNDLRGITTRFEIKAGSTPGTAQLVVTPRAEGLWTGKAEVDVNGSRFMGPVRLSGVVQRNSPFGRGDGITGNLLASTTGGLGFALLGYNTPIGGDGFKVGASLSAVRYQLDKEDFPLDLRGTAVTTTAYGLYPVVRARNLNLFVLGSLEHKTYNDRKLSISVEKSVDTLAAGTTGDFRDSLVGGGVNTYDLSLTGGRVRYADGRPDGLEDDERFTKVTGTFTRLQDVLTGRVLAYVAIRGQYTRDNLDTTEQFRIGGPDGVRAFAPGEGTGDLGAIITLELRFLPPEEWLGPLARELVGNLFYDAAHVRYQARLGTRSPDTGGTVLANADTFSAVGFGVAWERPGEYALRASLAWPRGGTPRSDPEVKSPRLYVQLSKSFR